MSNIFKDFAPNYWDAGLPVIPLKRWDSPGKGRGKAPILNEWTTYSAVMPSEAMRAHWMMTYPESNIGLPFGPASGLCAIDIDTEDQALIDAIRNALPNSPWVRVGKKGMGLIYRWSGQPNFKLRDNENQSLVEFLGQGNQMVMPPSIHPDTERPYVSDTNLWEVLDKIQPLPTDLERVLRVALEPILGERGYSLAQTGRSGPMDVVPQGERDIQMVRHAGYLARVVMGIDKTNKFNLGEAMMHMRHWVENFTATSSGDDMDPEKGVAKLVEFLLKDVEKGKTLPEGWDTGLTQEQRDHPAIAEMIKKNEIQRWTISKASDWIAEKILEQPDDRDWAIARVMELTSMIARDENFSEFEFKTLIPILQKAAADAGMKLTKPDLSSAFKSARRGDEEMAADHEAIARQVFDEMNQGGELKFDQGRFWQWNGSCWEELSDNYVYMQVAMRIKGNVLAKRHNDYVSLTKTIAKIAESPLIEQFEDGINFANGFLDANLILHEHSPKYGKTFTLPFNYIPERATEAHKWFDYLEQSWGDDADYSDKVAALQEAFAVTMFGKGPSYQRAILLHGKAHTGKTQALNVLSSLMPPGAQCSISPTDWGEKFHIVKLVGKALNVCGELPETGSIAGDRFKEVIEGGIQSDSYKGKDIFEFRPMATHWFASNFLPKSADSSSGFSRRWLIFDFNRPVKASEKIIDFHKILIAEEREAIAAWAVLGLARVVAQKGFTECASHKLRLNQVVRGNNSVAAFLQSNDKIRASTGDVADTRTCFDAYVWYMKDVSRGFSVSYERFMNMLGELGHECEPWVDATGVTRHRTKDMKIITPVLPK